MWSAGAVVTVAATGGALALWLGRENPFEPSYGGITCSKVRACADAFRRGELSAEVLDQIRQHLSKCGPCRAFYQRLGPMAQKLAQNPPSAVPGS